MPPLNPNPAPSTQFDQTLIGLGIYIPLSPSDPTSNPSSSATTLLSPPAAFHTPQTNRRSAPRTLGTRNGFRTSSIIGLPRSIYAGDDNPFLPYPAPRDAGSEAVDEDETSEDLRPKRRFGQKGQRRSKEYDQVILSDWNDELDNLPESKFDTPHHGLLSPAFVSRSKNRYIPARPGPRNLGGADPSLAGLIGPGPDPSYPTSNEPISPSIPATPRPAISPSQNDPTPSTPISLPHDYTSAAASPHPTPSGPGGGGIGLLASALSEDIAPVSNPLFAASVALSVVLGVLIVGLVSCSVAYCRRGKRGLRGDGGDEEKLAGGEGSGSPKRGSLAGIYTRRLGEKGTPTKTIGSQRSSLKSSDTLTSFSTRSSTLVDSPSASESKSTGRVSFAEMIDSGRAAEEINRQLYSPPKWQPSHSSPLASAAPIFPPESEPSPDSSSSPSTTARSARIDGKVTESSSRLSICAVPPLDPIQEESIDSHSHPQSPRPPSRRGSTPSTHTLVPSPSSSGSAVYEETESTSYHSCSDNSSMTTHASDDAFGYTSRPSSIADSLFGRPSSLSIPNRSSVASSAPSFDFPLYLIDALDPDDTNPELDMSFDTISSISVSTPRTSPSPPPSLDSPIPLQSSLRRARSVSAVKGDGGDGDRRKTLGDLVTGSPSVKLRTRFALADDEESESEAEQDDDNERESEMGGIPAKVLFIDTTRTSTFQSPSSSGDIKRSLSLPSKPIPASQSKSVLKRALSALRSGSPTPSSPSSSSGPISLAELQYGPPTPPRLSRKPTHSRPKSTISSVSVIIHQSDLDTGTRTGTGDKAQQMGAGEEDSDGIARFSTASWDQLGQSEGFDAYYLGYGAGGECAEDVEGAEDEEEGEDVMTAEINQARISFGFLSSDMGHSDGCAFGLEQLQAFPEPASHLPYIRITSH